MFFTKKISYSLKTIFNLYLITLLSDEVLNAKLPKESEPDSVCAKPPDSGTGNALIHQWYFSVEIAQCRPIVYKGSGGNDNRFPTSHECESKCMRIYIEGAENSGPQIKSPVNFKAPNKPHHFYSHRVGRNDRRSQSQAHRKSYNSMTRRMFRPSLRQRRQRGLRGHRRHRRYQRHQRRQQRHRNIRNNVYNSWDQWRQAFESSKVSYRPQRRQRPRHRQLYMKYEDPDQSEGFSGMNGIG